MNPFFYSTLLFVLMSSSLLSLPEGTQSMTTGGSFSVSGSEMTITAPDNSIFHHEKFNVGPDETVRFIQQSSQSRVLNRVVGPAVQSSIQGDIRANGNVYLVNPAGVVFGPGSTVEVGRLHVVAGSLSDDNFKAGIDQFESLSGEVRNDGKITAQSVSFSGARVVNNGQIYAPEGYIVLAEGEGNSSSLSLSSGSGSTSLKLIDSKGDIVVNVISSDSTPSTMITDLGGQALLQSGILEASHVELHGKTIQANGSIKADTVRVVPRSSIQQSGSANKIEVQKLYIEEGSAISSSSSSTTNKPSVDLSSSSNQIPEVYAAGSFSKLSVRSKPTMEVNIGSFVSSTSSQSLNVREVDFRVYDGDLRLKDSISPLNFSSSNIFLLAASKKVYLDQPTSYPFTTRVVYAQSMIETPEVSSSTTSPSSTSSSSSSVQSFITLRATSIGIDDLAPNLPPETILLLARENPEFAALQSSQQVQLEGLSDAQLAVLFEYDYLSGYSYFLRSLSLSPASLFGDDFSIFAKTEAEASFLEVDENEGTISADPTPSRIAQVASAVQFSPITMPLLSPPASEILDRALDDDIKNSLQRFIK